MSRLRTAFLGVAVWCAVVAGVSTLVWVVIERAGQGVVPEAKPQADVTGSLPVPHDDRRPALRTSPGPTLAPRPVRRTTSPPTPVSSSTPPATPTSRPPSSHPVKNTPPPSGPTPQRRSWSGGAGHVVAECRGATAQLVSAFPGTGWRYTILARGPGSVRVRFQRLGQSHYLTVDARCVAGVPRFATADDTPGDE